MSISNMSYPEVNPKTQQVINRITFSNESQVKAVRIFFYHTIAEANRLDEYDVAMLQFEYNIFLSYPKKKALNPF